MNLHDNDQSLNGADESGSELQLENELLKLKMQAELGAHFGTFPGMPELSPELERDFLERILFFEQQSRELEPVAVREYLGHPVFRPAAELAGDELEAEWERLQALYREKDLNVDFMAEYPLALMYDFLAVEFMDEQMEPSPGWCYIYEEFHPNHDYDLRARTEDFLMDFFRGRLHEHHMSPRLCAPDGLPVALDAAQALLERFHGVFGAITEWHFDIAATGVQLTGGPADMPRLGTTEGTIRYSVTGGDDVPQQIEGPFRLQLECTYGWWSVMGFVIHGFSWGGDATVM